MDEACEDSTAHWDDEVHDPALHAGITANNEQRRHMMTPENES